MVDDLIDIGAEVLGAGIEAVALANINPDKETSEIKKNRKHGLITAMFMGIFLIGMGYMMLRWRLMDEFSVVIDEIGLIGFIAVIILTLVVLGLGFIGYFKKRNKDIKRIYVLIGLSGICTAVMIPMLYQTLYSTSLLIFIASIGFTFGITLMFFMLFEKIGDVKTNQIIRLPYHLMMRFCIPMMFVWVIFMGAMKGKYGYESVFLHEVELNLIKYFGEITGGGFNEVVSGLFNIGASRPSFFLFLTVAAALVLLYTTIRYSFFKDKWPYEKTNEEYKDAEYFIGCADDKFLSKEDLNCFKRGKLRLNKTYLDKCNKREGGENE